MRVVVDAHASFVLVKHLAVLLWTIARVHIWMYICWLICISPLDVSQNHFIVGHRFSDRISIVFKTGVEAAWQLACGDTW